MRYAPPPRSNLFPAVILGMALLVFGLMGTVSTLWTFGAIEIPFLRRLGPGPNYEGMVPVPVSARAIPAYTRVTRDDLFDLKTATLKVIYVRPEEVRPDMLTRLDKILGRVLGYDKPPGYAFRDEDFLPEGTRAGPVAGIPAGKRGLHLEADKIKGIETLKLGDHFDLIASIPMDDRRGTPGNVPLVAGWRQDAPKRAFVRALAQDGVVVSPLTIRQVPTGAPAPPGRPMPTKPVQEVDIALDPKESAALAEAFALHAEVVCVARSGRPEDQKSPSVTPGVEPPKRVVIEVTRGAKREFIEYPARPDAPAPDAGTPADSSPPPAGGAADR